MYFEKDYEVVYLTVAIQISLVLLSSLPREAPLVFPLYPIIPTLFYYVPLESSFPLTLPPYAFSTFLSFVVTSGFVLKSKDLELGSTNKKEHAAMYVVIINLYFNK